jgi:hypothetical protein
MVRPHQVVDVVVKMPRRDRSMWTVSFSAFAPFPVAKLVE